MMRALHLLCLFLVPMTTATAADQFTLHAKTYRVGPNPSSIVAVDLNGDAILDLVSASRGRLRDIREERPAEDSLSLLIGADDLRFDSQPPLRSGFGPYCVVAANIDALKAMDLVVANFHATRDRDITLLRNIGALLFEPHHFTIDDDMLEYTQLRDGDGHPVFTTPGLTAIAVADIDGDRLRDVVATAWSSDALAVFPGEEERYFGTPTRIDLPGGPRDLVLRDLDGDGRSDLAVTLYNANEIALLRGDGNGGFQLFDRFSSRGKLPQKIRVADMNGDGRDDLVVTHAHADDSIVIFYGEGGMHYPVAQEISLGENRQRLEYGIRDIVVDDFDSDKRNDIALACHTKGEVVILRNTSKKDAIPQSYVRETHSFGEGRPACLFPADFNRDGATDLAVGLWETNEIALLLNRD